MRSCGTCSACCRWPEIPELKKPVKVPCSRLEECGFGCSAYALRPPSCRDFQCSWVEGHGHSSDIPDTSGVMLFRRDSQFGEVIVAVDLGFGSLRTKKKAIKRIARDANLVVTVVDKDNSEKIVLAYAPDGVKMPKKLAHMEVM